MRGHASRLAALLLPALGLALLDGDGGRAADVPRPLSGRMVLEHIEADELTNSLRQVIRDELNRLVRDQLKAFHPDDRARTRAGAAALLIAARAQNGRGAREPRQRAALRDNALRIKTALADEDFKAGRRQADALLDYDRRPPRSEGAALRGLMDLEEVKCLLRGRRSGGLGVGPATPAGNRDGIEVRIILLARKAPAQAELDAESAELARAAAVVDGMADLIDAYTPDKKVGDKDPKDWKAHTDEMRAGAAALETAARAKDVKAVQAAAARLYASCIGCHEIFRD